MQHNPWPDLFYHMAETSILKALQNSKVEHLYNILMKAVKRVENGGYARRARGIMTQNDKILNHIDKNGSISQREAIMDYSIQSLTKRISELREEGWPIVREIHTHPVTGQRYARYKFDAESEG